MGKIKSQKVKFFSTFLFLFLILGITSGLKAQSFLEFEKGSLTVESSKPVLLSAYYLPFSEDSYLFKEKYISAGTHHYTLRLGDKVQNRSLVFVMKTFSYKYLKTFSSFGSGPGNLFQPAAIAVDNLNNLYIADSNNDRIEIFNLNGGYVSQFGVFNWAEGDFFDNRDDSKFESDSMFENQGNSLNDPEDIAIGQFIYVLDKGNNRVVKFNNDYSYVSSIGKYGSGRVEFLDARSIAVDEIENLYIVDYERDRVVKTDSNGAYLFEVGAFGNGKDNLNKPIAVCVDKNRNFYVAEEGNKRVVVFDENGLFQWEFPCITFKDLTNLSSWKNYLFLIDSEGKKVILTTKKGRKLLEITNKSFEKPVDSVMIDDKYLYVVDREANNIKIFEIKENESKFTRKW